MAGESGTTGDVVALYRALQQVPYKFDFFQALRRLECAHRDKPAIGRSLRPSEDPIRLGQNPELTFAGATLDSFQPGRDGRAWRLTSHFFGLFGPNGPLPLHLTEHARDRVRNFNDPTFVHFLDVFHHRMLSLFYRGWAMASPTVSYDRPESDRFALYVGALFGTGTEGMRRRDAMPDLAKYHFAGRLAARTRDAEGLRAMLTELFRTPSAVEEFIGHWMRLPNDCRCLLGTSATTGTLGVSTIVGSHVWDCQTRFRIVLGPMGLADYEGFLPGGRLLECLIAVVRNYVGDELSWEANLILRREEVPPTVLGASGRLGMTTWLVTHRPPPHDPADLTLLPLPEVA